MRAAHLRCTAQLYDQGRGDARFCGRSRQPLPHIRSAHRHTCWTGPREAEFPLHKPVKRRIRPLPIAIGWKRELETSIKVIDGWSFGGGLCGRAVQVFAADFGSTGLVCLVFMLLRYCSVWNGQAKRPPTIPLL